MNLRFIERDGKMILQQEFWCNIIEPRPEWQDVPVHKEPIKPLANFQCECGIFYDNAADAATCGEKFDPFENDMHSFIKKLKKTPLGGHKEPESPKKPSEWRIFKDINGTLSLDGSKGNSFPIVVTEVPKEYKLISRDEILKAWDSTWAYRDAHKFLKELGFE